MRMIEKLSRPIDKTKKESYLMAFTETMYYFNQDLRSFQASIMKKDFMEDNTRAGKSMEDSESSRNKEIRKKVKQV